MACRVLKNKGATVTSKFGNRIHPVTGEVQSFHKGVDIVGSGYVADYIVAHTGGTVEIATYSSTAGNYVAIRVSDTCVMRYLHMRDLPSVKVGQRVEAGTVLGYMGTTGTSTGVHLHFDICENGQYIDPEPFLYSDYLEDDMTYDKFKEYMQKYEQERGEQQASSWAKTAWDSAVSAGVFDGTRPRDPLTRQELAVIKSRGQI